MSAGQDLDDLAQLHGILPRYTDATGQEHVVSTETKRALLAVIGVPAATAAETAGSLEHERALRRSETLSPATVVTQAPEMRAVLRTPPAADGAHIAWSIALEDGGVRRGKAVLSDLAAVGHDGTGGSCAEGRGLPLPVDLPAGYHRLQVGIRGGGTPDVSAEGALIVAPARCHLPDRPDRPLPWAIAVQLYGLCSSQSWGMGDFGDLARFARTAGDLGADAVALSPIHALFPADPGHFGPYGPSSRLFLNVMHIDVAAVPGFAESELVRQRCEEPTVRGALDAARRSERVEYEAVAAAKMPVLEASWEWFRAAATSNSGFAAAKEFERFKVEGGAALTGHALFDALHEHFFRADPACWHWTNWPEPFRDHASTAVAEFERHHATRVDFFRYLQWQADRQLARAHREALNAGMSIGLYRDLAIGMHPGGAMAWLHPETVVTGATVGAPPDAFNQLGQDWGIAAISPRGLRSTEFASHVAMLRANMRHAGVLRIDHVMGLERLFCIPAGGKPGDGAYLAYPSQAMRGLLALESRRNGCMVIGEDLGTVPGGFRETMADTGILTYKLLYFERESDGRFRDPRTYPRDCVAAATTHDLPPLAGYWRGRDLEWRRDLGLFRSEDELEKATADRAADRRALLDLLVSRGLVPQDADERSVTIEMVIEAVYAALAEAPSRLLVAQAEDLLCMVEQPNLPGTFDQHPNWRRKLATMLDDIGSDPAVNAIAQAIRHRRPREG